MAGFFATFDLVLDFLDEDSGSRLLYTVQDHPGIRACPHARQLFGTAFECDNDCDLGCWSCDARKADTCGDVDKRRFEAA